MGFNVQIVGVVAVINTSDSGRYITALDAVMASLRAAHDINVRAISFDGKTYSLIDEFTEGLRQNSAVIYDILGITVPDLSLAHRFCVWVRNGVATFLAGSQCQEGNFQLPSSPRKTVGVEDDIRARNRLSYLVMGRHK